MFNKIGETSNTFSAQGIFPSLFVTLHEFAWIYSERLALRVAVIIFNCSILDFTLTEKILKERDFSNKKFLQKR